MLIHQLGQGLNRAFLLQHEARTENAPCCGTWSWCEELTKGRGRIGVIIN